MEFEKGKPTPLIKILHSQTNSWAANCSHNPTPLSNCLLCAFSTMVSIFRRGNDSTAEQ